MQAQNITLLFISQNIHKHVTAADGWNDLVEGRNRLHKADNSVTVDSQSEHASYADGSISAMMQIQAVFY